LLSIAQKLDQLSILYSQRNSLQEEELILIEKTLPPEFKARLNDIEAEFSQQDEAAAANINSLEAESKSETHAFGDTVKASGFIARWNHGRVSWDNKGLTNFAGFHPELLDFRKEGEPSITIRRVQANDLAK